MKTKRTFSIHSHRSALLAILIQPASAVDLLERYPTKLTAR